ncbi:MAG: Flavin-dependent oxidoreductase, luciferase family [Chloroflexi bacterium]|jgi:alkanesulfonate monooxygenase SsuD/methylene tetrahydromethanopterin reductase-like flavin-dependent oxidoreductase (luciferase family)|nr:MAG: Flavin-dependent oxidoreductase, luciferase family [Chloroflexota bacterium]
MKFGAFFLLQSPQARPTEEVYTQVLDQIRYADDLGFDSVWIAEHHFSTYGYCPNPLMLAVKAAQITKRVRVGTAVIVLPFWHPLRLAEDIALADVLTEGRLDVGVARGYQPYEFERLGLDISESRALSDETLDVLLKALTTVGFEHKGKYYNFPETTTYPRPLQQPHTPIWLAATSKESVESAVRRRLNLFTTSSTRPMAPLAETWAVLKNAWQEHGVAPESMEFAVQQHVHVAPTDRKARDRLEHSLWHHRHSNRLRLGTVEVTKGVAHAAPMDDEPSLEELYDTHTIAGSPERVREKIEEYQETAGLTQLNCYLNLGSLDQDIIKDSMRLMAEKVIPHFK